MDKNFQVRLFLDTMNIQNLIWSICLKMIVAILLRLDKINGRASLVKTGLYHSNYKL